jgi:acetyl-CoA carboxylase beta subunit
MELNIMEKTEDKTENLIANECPSCKCLIWVDIRKDELTVCQMCRAKMKFESSEPVEF